MTEDEMRTALAEAIPSGNINWTDEEQADALLPTVRRIVAEELRAAQDDRTTVSKLTPVEALTCFIVKLEDLFHRAETLDPR